jgi:hypothetical protein
MIVLRIFYLLRLLIYLSIWLMLYKIRKNNLKKLRCDYFISQKNKTFIHLIEIDYTCISKGQILSEISSILVLY